EQLRRAVTGKVMATRADVFHRPVLIYTRTIDQARERVDQGFWRTCRRGVVRVIHDLTGARVRYHRGGEAEVLALSVYALWLSCSASSPHRLPADYGCLIENSPAFAKILNCKKILHVSPGCT